MVRDILEKSKQKFDNDRYIFADAILRILDENEMLKLQYRHIRDSKIIEISYLIEDLMKLQVGDKEENVRDNTELPINSEREDNREKIITEPVVTEKAKSRKSSKKI